jgi:hypothetical protein
MTFSDVIETVKILSFEEKEQLQELLQQYLREERRSEIYANFEAATIAEQNDELKFSAHVAELRLMMEE